jgi:hypothetical protein
VSTKPGEDQTIRRNLQRDVWARAPLAGARLNPLDPTTTSARGTSGIEVRAGRPVRGARRRDPAPRRAWNPSSRQPHGCCAVRLATIEDPGISAPDRADPRSRNPGSPNSVCDSRSVSPPLGEIVVGRGPGDERKRYRRKAEVQTLEGVIERMARPRTEFARAGEVLNGFPLRMSGSVPVDAQQAD